MTTFAQNKIIIPDTDKHLVLTGDMHMHTIFSDGNVWPTTRVESSNPEVLYSRFQVIYPFESQEYICRGPVYKAPLELKEFVLTFEVENFYTAPGQNLVYSITIKR